MFPKVGVENPAIDGEFIMENPMNKWDDLGVKPIIFKRMVTKMGS